MDVEWRDGEKAKIVVITIQKILFYCYFVDNESYVDVEEEVIVSV